MAFFLNLCQCFQYRRTTYVPVARVVEVHEHVRVDRVIVEVREVCLDHIENSKHYVGSGANRKIHSFHASKVHLHVRQVESNQQLMEAVPHLLGHEHYNTETYR